MEVGPNEKYHRMEGPCLDRTVNAAILGGAAGTFFGSCFVAWYPDPVTSPLRAGHYARGLSAPSAVKSDVGAILTGVARPALFFSVTSAAFAAAECLAEEVRGTKEDPWNSAIAGATAGAVMGASTGRFDVMASAAIGTGLFFGVLDLFGPETVSRPDELHHKRYGILPRKHVESEELSSLKEKYPQHEDL